MRTYIFNHTSFETAYEVKDYPYGFRLRTSMFYWIETVAKKGDRFCSCTINPKNGRLNAPKKSTFSNIGVMFLDENNHVKWEALNIYAKPEEVKAFAERVGEANLNPEQIKQLRQLKGEKIVVLDKITGDAKKDFAIKWEKYQDKYNELRITFDRPDGVTVKEIFNALKSVNQVKLNEVFQGVQSKNFGTIDGIVRICVRGGLQLTTVKKDTYNEWLASDHNVETAELDKTGKDEFLN